MTSLFACESTISITTTMCLDDRLFAFTLQIINFYARTVPECNHRLVLGVLGPVTSVFDFVTFIFYVLFLYICGNGLTRCVIEYKC